MIDAGDKPDSAGTQSNAPIAFHPICIAILPVLSLFFTNILSTPLGDILLPLLVCGFVALLLCLICRLVTKSSAHAAILASLCLAVVFLYGPLDSLRIRYVAILCGGLILAAGVQFFRTSSNQPRWTPIFLVIGGVAIFAGKLAGRFDLGYLAGSAALIIWNTNTQFDASKTTRFLNSLSVVLLLSCIVVGLPALMSGSSVSATHKQDKNEIDLAKPATMRDIYFLVFDRYAGNQTLQSQYDFDNSDFYDSLRERGFYVADNSYCNYPLTPLSMSATLNLRHHDSQLRSLIEYQRELHDHQVGRSLKRIGYQFWHIGNWYDPLRHNKTADVNFQVSWLNSEFANVLWDMTIFSQLIPGTSDRDHAVIRRQFKMLKQSAEDEHPKFVYAHFLIPHPPYLFDRDGKELTRQEVAKRSRKDNFVNQLVFTNTQITEVVDHILQKSKIPPIIVIQADEGPYLNRVDANDEDLEPADQYRKRTNIISAFYLPGKDIKFPPGMTPINTFPIIFREYFDSKIELLPDRVFYWQYTNPQGEGGRPDFKRPNELIDVTKIVNGAN